jgi:uncharacterized repeat protein (TIGR01451 family)
MKKSNLTFVMMLSLCALLVAVLLPRQAKAATWQDKVDPWVMETALQEGQTEFLVYLTEQADVSAAADITTKEAKGNYVYQTLTATADRTQGPLLTALREAGVEHQAYWVANMIWVRGDLNLVQQLALRSDVGHIYANPTVQIQLPVADESELIEAAMAVEWNITMVNADDVWAEGYTGQGIVIGGQDTGYDWDHPALINQYRGWNGSTADHNYNWHDSIHSGGGGNPCGYNSPVPCDDNGHGTHTMGTMVGNDMLPSNPSWPAGATNAVGMAPGARWISCRNMDSGNGTPTTYSECYQWFIAPTDLTGSNPDTTKAPHVINNSWACPPSEGCTDPNIMLTIVNNVRAAGIVTVHSAGNSGSGCSTVSDPSAIYDASYTVGSTTSSNTMSSFSSRGPVTIDGSNRLKPDISAPGSGIRSSTPGTGYGNSSGTSMAGPHVAGLVGLLLSVRPDMVGDVDDIEAIINSTAVPVNVTQTCGGIPSSTIPNNTFGYGRIDALAMYNAATTVVPHSFALLKEATPGSVNHGEMITYTLTITHHHPTSATTNVVLTDTIPVGTTFVSATGPYALVGDTVEWSYASISAGASESVQLVVEVEHTATGPVVNDDYGVMSDEVTTPVIGSPVTVIIIPMGLTEAVYLPVILKD